MNIEHVTAEELISKLIQLTISSYQQYQLYPENSIEQKQILRAQRVPAELLILLQKAEECCKSTDLKEATLSYVKDTLIKEQNKRLKELELSQQFLNGEMECKIHA